MVLVEGARYQVSRFKPVAQYFLYTHLFKFDARVGVYMSISNHPVGTALCSNPFAPYIPCHRVIHSSLYIGTYAQPRKDQLKVQEMRGDKKKKRKIEDGSQEAKKRDLLEAEGVFFTEEGMLMDKENLWDGKN